MEHLKPEEILMYLRKSRADDPNESVEETLEKHLEILNRWMEKNLPSPIPIENLFKEVVSGETIADRPEFRRLLKLIESPRYKAILVLDLARLGRPDMEEIGKLSKIFRYTHTLVITPMKIFDMEDEYERDMFERDLKRGNETLEYQKKIQKRGKELSVSQGNYIASIPPYGYDKIEIKEGKRKCPTLAINEEQANVVRMIFDLYVNHNMGYKAICNHLNSLHIPTALNGVWTPITIMCMLKNIHYIGKVKYYERKTVIVVEDGEVKKTKPYAKKGDYMIYDGKHPAIISEELFYAAQERLGKNPRAKADRELQNPLAGILYCRCGAAMMMRKYLKPSGGGVRCSSRVVCTKQTHCQTSSTTLDEILDFVETLLKQKIAEFEVEVTNNNNNSHLLYEKRIKSLEKKLDELQAKELAQWEAQSDPDPAKRMPQHIFQMLNEKLLKEREETKLAIKEAYDNIPQKVDYEQKIVTFQKALDYLRDDSKSALEKNALLKQCIKRIVYSRERPDVPNRWNGLPIELDVTLMV